MSPCVITFKTKRSTVITDGTGVKEIQYFFTKDLTQMNKEADIRFFVGE